MIIGLDHLSLNFVEKKKFHRQIFNYKKVYGVKSLNHKEKNKFISKKIKNHCINFFATNKNLPPIEKLIMVKINLTQKILK